MDAGWKYLSVLLCRRNALNGAGEVVEDGSNLKQRKRVGKDPGLRPAGAALTSTGQSERCSARCAVHYQVRSGLRN